MEHKHEHSKACMEEEFRSKIINGLLTCQGHISAITKMVTNGKSCEDILLQISAVDGAIRKIGKQLLKNHLEHCVRDGVEKGDQEALTDFGKLLDRYLSV